MKEFEFRGLTFRTLYPVGLEVKVADKWHLTDFLNQQALFGSCGSEIPDISLWNEKKCVIGRVEFPK